MASELAKIVDGVNVLAEYAQFDDYLAIINQDPPAKFLNDHPTAKGVKYMPIGIVESILTKVFQDWYVEVLKTGQLLNSVEVTVRLHYWQPLKQAWRHQDGVGAAPIQTDAGKNASDMGAIKNNAIMLALPAAKSYAIKDAAEEIGKLFGRDINRKDAMGFDPAYGTEDTKENLRNIAKDNIEKAKAKAHELDTDENT
jgi:hypothetical protein